ncbi:MAG: hypothetical protein EOP51_05790 [Sphingobacteriales bacterium]|nr:MAG: hypothetical protein EOP51_05790 [Sphingobacteriales bacterium]
MLAKLKIKPGVPLWLIARPASVNIDTEGIDVHESVGKANELAQVLLFAENKKSLDPQLDKILLRLADKAVFWIAYPKKSGRIESDLIRYEGWDKVFASGYRVVASVAINDDWSAVRISKIDANKVYKSATPITERKTPGIDYVNRTATLQDDIAEAFAEFEGLSNFFETMSFTHKREYIEHVEEAKKPETRQKRLAQTVNAVLDMQHKKMNKKTK